MEPRDVISPRSAFVSASGSASNSRRSFFPISEVVFLPLMVGLSKSPNDSDRAQLEAYKQPYTRCLLAKGYKPQ